MFHFEANLTNMHVNVVVVRGEASTTTSLASSSIFKILEHRNGNMSHMDQHVGVQTYGLGVRPLMVIGEASCKVGYDILKIL